MNEGRNGDQDILEAAIGAVREERFAEVSPALLERTRARVRERVEESTRRAPHSWRRRGVTLMRIAAVFVLAGFGTAAFFLLRDDAPDQIAHSNDRAVTDVPVVRGLVRFVGTAPKPQPLSMAAEAHCAQHHRGEVMDESVLVNADGTLRNVVVWISGGLEGKEFAPPKEPAVLDQQGCVYTPHVVPVMTGQRLLVKNSDPFLHNVNADADQNPPFNFGQPTVDGSGRPMVFSEPEPEPMLVRCNVHPWMSAFIHVIDNPFFAVTGGDGSFALGDLPPGEYTLAAWHEVYGRQERRVKVEAGKPVDVEFSFGATAQSDDGFSPALAAAACCASPLR